MGKIAKRIKKLFIQELTVKRIVLLVLSAVYIIKNLVYNAQDDSDIPDKEYHPTQEQLYNMDTQPKQMIVACIIALSVYIGLRYINHRQEKNEGAHTESEVY